MDRKQPSFEQRVRHATDSMMAVLIENELYAELRDLLLHESFEHGMQNSGDVTNMTYAGKHGYYLRFGHHLPAGQNPERPDEVEVFCGIEEPQIPCPPYSDGFRLSHRVAANSWYLRSWSVSDRIQDIGGIRRNILGLPDAGSLVEVPKDKVPLVLARIAQLYMKGA